MGGFFSNIKSLPSAGGWKINIAFDGDEQIVVSVLLETDGKGRPLPPMLLKGTAEELDNAFFEVIATPVANTVELFANRDSFAKELDKAREEVKKKAGEVKTAKVALKKTDIEQEPTRKFEDVMKKISELNAICKYADALEILPPNSEFPEKKEELEKLRRELEWKRNQLTLL
ncbi:MAG: PRTRC system protein E [Chitinophagaceae bacterium]|nr:MAG: PRTRC system protein E [Chitinophagaceae bacterium]